VTEQQHCQAGQQGACQNDQFDQTHLESRERSGPDKDLSRRIRGQSTAHAGTCRGRFRLRDASRKVDSNHYHP
jgi:hypothetical protein